MSKPPSSATIARDSVPSPTGPLAAARRGELQKILSKKAKPGVNVTQFVTDIESIIDGLKTPRPQWLQELVTQGKVSLKAPTVATFFPEQRRDKRRLQRVRDGLTALAQVLDELPAGERQRLSHEAFVAAANGDPTADVALTALLEHVLSGVKNTITVLSQATPPSDPALQRIAKLGGLVAAFHKHGQPIRLGERSPFIRVCEEARISRGTVKRYLPHLKTYGFDRLVAATFGP